jgi:hypothetical protein
MLRVATFEVGNPITEIVLVESDNPAVGIMIGFALISHWMTTLRLTTVSPIEKGAEISPAR